MPSFHLVSIQPPFPQPAVTFLRGLRKRYRVIHLHKQREDYRIYNAARPREVRNEVHLRSLRVFFLDFSGFVCLLCLLIVCFVVLELPSGLDYETMLISVGLLIEQLQVVQGLFTGDWRGCFRTASAGSNGSHA